MTFGELADLMTAQAAAVPKVAKAGAVAGAELIRKDARDRIGEYQEAIGDVPAWAPLADSTKADRVRQGYSEDEPLLRSGALRDAVDVREVVDGAEVGVFEGEMQQIAAWMEFGTVNTPPRSFLRAATYAKEDEAVAGISARVAAVLEETKR